MLTAILLVLLIIIRLLILIIVTTTNITIVIVIVIILAGPAQPQRRLPPRPATGGGGIRIFTDGIRNPDPKTIFVIKQVFLLQISYRLITLTRGLSQISATPPARRPGRAARVGPRGGRGLASIITMFNMLTICI